MTARLMAGVFLAGWAPCWFLHRSQLANPRLPAPALSHGAGWSGCFTAPAFSRPGPGPLTT